MPKSPYPGFTKLNNRRIELLNKKFGGKALTETEEREMEMLGTCVGAMCHFRWPYRDFDKEFKEKTGYTLEEMLETVKKEKKK